tara:strand:- start:510 stop:821 length:312 start_codon:yes stop_codon:yes gene_type:complete
MFNIEDIIGDIVYIDFQDNSIYNEIGVSNNINHFLVKGYDHIGIWLAHPKLYRKKDKKELLDANFLVSWNNVKNIMHYPNREGYDFPSEFDKDIGFKTTKDKK